MRLTPKYEVKLLERDRSYYIDCALKASAGKRNAIRYLTDNYPEHRYRTEKVSEDLGEDGSVEACVLKMSTDRGETVHYFIIERIQ